jgi:8-oxo-dGTP pyrophosphatase MutT (NUDIX family)
MSLSIQRPTIIDPRAVPVVGRDDHLPAVPADRLTADAVRRRIAFPPAWEPERLGDGRVFDGYPRTRAAVLVPLVQRGDGLTVLLTQRTAHLRDHAGQVAFPGGRADPGDETDAHTALREAEEEVGLERGRVDVIGTLPVYRTVTNFDVTPVLGLVMPPLKLAIDPHEVAEAFEVPLRFLMTPAHHWHHRAELEGVRRDFLSMPFPRPDGQGDHFIWGATAAMLRNFYRLLIAP